MKLLNRLERKFGDLAIPNLTVYLIALQSFAFVMSLVYPDFRGKLVLSHDRLVAGEWWRLLTVLIMPPSLNVFFMFLFVSFYYFAGTTLEAQWGTFRYNLYILIGYLTTLLAALIPDAKVTNFYLMESVFLAFAWLYPECPILLYGILPVKAKWLGLAAWIMYLIAFFSGGWDTKAEVVAGALNFAIFFHADLWQAVRTYPRRFRSQMAQARAREAKPPMHVCAVCGVTDQSDKKMEFRYCPLCTGTPAYCINHIHNHQHR
jgi:hypothetical protein